MDNMTTLGETNGTVPDIAQQGNSGASNTAAETAATPPVAGEEQTTGADAPTDDRAEVWQRMVDGEYKDLFTRDTQRIINARFKHVKGLEQQLADNAAVLEQVMDHFGIEGGDVEGLRRMLDEQTRTRARDKARVEGLVRQQMSRWGQEVRQVKEVYPDFDLKRELSDAGFRALITNPRRPVSLRRAYEVTHLEGIKQAVARRQAAATEQRVVDSIRARGARPSENGTSAQSGFTVREDVSRLTPGQLADIRKRVMSGERISFG